MPNLGAVYNIPILSSDMSDVAAGVLLANNSFHLRELGSGPVSVFGLQSKILLRATSD